MKLVSFRVRKFRNIIDSGSVRVDPSVTCLVGKNESGKSALLEALYLLNPAYREGFQVEDQYPRWLVVRDRRADNLLNHEVVSVTLELETGDTEVVVESLGEDVLKGSEVTVSRTYGGELVWTIPVDEEAAVRNLFSAFPESLKGGMGKLRTLEELRGELKSIAGAELGDHGPTREDVQRAIETLRRSGLENSSVCDRIVDLLWPRVPRFFRFTNYSTLPGRIDFRELQQAREEGPGRSDIQTARALLKLAGTDLAQLGNEDYELRKGELEAVQIDLTNQVFSYWKQNPELEVIIDVDKETLTARSGTTAVARFLDIRLRDKRTGYSNNFSQRSSGFQWFFSFLAAFSEFEGDDSFVVLLDEPALTLHARAQGDFIRFINERISPSSPVIYTTHSPFMVEPDHLQRVRIVEDQGPPTGATVTEETLAVDKDSLFPLQAALGYDIAQNLFVGPHNLVVEGTSEYIYLTVMSRLCAEAGGNALDTRWRIIPAGGAANIPTFVSLIGPYLEITVLADSNAKGMQRVMNMISQGLLSAKRLVLVNVATESANADIEDLFSVEDYLELYNRTFQALVEVADLPDGDRIVKRIEAKYGPFDHGQVAETLLRDHHQIAFTNTTTSRFSTLIQVINNTIELG